MRLYGELHRFIPVLAAYQGYRIAEIPVNHRPRQHGRSRYGPERYLRGFFDLLSVTFMGRYRYRPLHLFGGIGVLMGAVGFIVLLYLTVLWFWGEGIGTRPLLTLGVLLDGRGHPVRLAGPDLRAHHVAARGAHRRARAHRAHGRGRRALSPGTCESHVKILAITSSYPRYEGDPTAPFVESIVRSVAAPGTRDPRSPSAAPRRGRGRRARAACTSTRTATRRRRSWTPWGFSESLRRRRRDPEAAVRACAARRSRRRSRAARALLARAASTSSTSTGSCRTGRSARWQRRARGSARHQPARLRRRGIRAVARDRSCDALVVRARLAVTAPSGDLLERARPSRRAQGRSSEFRTAPTSARSRSRQTQPTRSGAGSASATSTLSSPAIGRLIPVKGFEYLVDATRRRSPRTAAPARARRRRRPARAHSRSAITRARRRRTRSFRRLRRSRARFPRTSPRPTCVAVPSIRDGGYVDGLPNVALEAMAAASRSSQRTSAGCRELVRDGENGLLVPEKDSARARRGIVATRRRLRTLRARLGASGQCRDPRGAEAGTCVGRRFVEVYERVLAER